MDEILALLFSIANTQYTIKCDKIREIAPMVHLKKVPHAPPYFAGYFNYRGTIVPVIDLSCLIQNTSCKMRLSTRIILVDYTGGKQTSHILGLMVERVTGTVRKTRQTFKSADIRSIDAPYIGGIVMDQDNMIQYIDLDLLPTCIQYLPVADNDHD